jgi:hypothetical protein
VLKEVLRPNSTNNVVGDGRGGYSSPPSSAMGKIQQWLKAEFNGTFRELGNTMAHGIQRVDDTFSCGPLLVNTVEQAVFGSAIPPFGTDSRRLLRIQYFKRLAEGALVAPAPNADNPSTIDISPGLNDFNFLQDGRGTEISAIPDEEKVVCNGNESADATTSNVSEIMEDTVTGVLQDTGLRLDTDTNNEESGVDLNSDRERGDACYNAKDNITSRAEPGTRGSEASEAEDIVVVHVEGDAEDVAASTQHGVKDCSRVRSSAVQLTKNKV